MPKAHASAVTTCPVPCRFVNYCISRVEVMKAAGVIPVIVFDGGRLPMKANEEESRARFVRHMPTSAAMPSNKAAPSNCVCASLIHAEAKAA